MATSFPAGLDALTNPTSADGLNSPDHAAQHANVNDAVEAIEVQIGTTAAPVLARLASPTFTGTPAAPTASAGTNTTQVATTAFVTQADNLKANLASPTFTGTVTAPTFSGALTGNATTATNLTSAGYTYYAPTWTSSGTHPAIGNGYIDGYYKTIGSLCHAVGYIIAGTTTTYGTGTYYISLPVAGYVGNWEVGTITLLDAGGGYVAYNGVSIFTTSTTVETRTHGSGLWTSTNPQTMSNGDQVRFNFIYSLA